MSFSKIRALAVVLTIVTAASAQFEDATNARKEALSGAPFSDITDVYKYPSLMNGYTNQVQATFRPDGGFIGIKSINDVLSIGLMANYGLVAPEPFYAAINSLNSVQDSPLPSNPFSDYYPENFFPHVLVGAQFGGFNLGADFFYERAAAKYSAESKETNPEDKYEAEGSGSVTMFGTRLSAGIDFGFMNILAKFGVGFPSFDLNYKATANGVDVIEIKDSINFESALYIETGVEAGMSLAGLDWTLGFGYTGSKHQPKNIETETVKTENIYWNSRLDVYLGAEFNVLETMAAAAGYSFRRDAWTHTYKNKVTIGDNSSETEDKDNSSPFTNSHLHTLNLGLENVWDNVWIFDAFAVRAGANYYITYEFTKNSHEYKSSSGSSEESESKFTDIWYHSPVYPTVGIGLSKSVFTLDLLLRMGQWDGIVAGPPVGMVTGTIKF